MAWPAIQGFGATLVLIAAIGAQNAFLLSQGVRRHYQWLAAGICLSTDLLMISAGVLGTGFLFSEFPNLAFYAQAGGAVFLLVYGSLAFQRFRQPSALKAESAANSRKTVIITALAVSWLNPHAYLDTVVLLGSIAGQFSGNERWVFWFGASLASVGWFVSLTWLATKLAPVLGKAKRWRWVELGVAASMWAIAVWLIVGLL